VRHRGRLPERAPVRERRVRSSLGQGRPLRRDERLQRGAHVHRRYVRHGGLPRGPLRPRDDVRAQPVQERYVRGPRQGRPSLRGEHRLHDQSVRQRYVRGPVGVRRAVGPAAARACTGGTVTIGGSFAFDVHQGTLAGRPRRREAAAQACGGGGPRRLGRGAHRGLPTTFPAPTRVSRSFPAKRRSGRDHGLGKASLDANLAAPPRCSDVALAVDPQAASRWLNRRAPSKMTLLPPRRGRHAHPRSL
jgi:hypothetical protein